MSEPTPAPVTITVWPTPGSTPEPGALEFGTAQPPAEYRNQPVVGGRANPRAASPQTGGLQERVGGRPGIVAEPIAELTSQEAAAMRAAEATAAQRTAPGFGPMGTGAGRRKEEDQEHYTPEYLHKTHEDFWDSGERTAPRVIGE
jgi:hypothetical protein